MIRLRDEDIKITRNDVAVAIELPGDVILDKLNEVEIEPIMHALSAVIGQRIGAIKIGGYWLIGNTDPATGDGKGWSPRYGHRPGEQKRKLTAALANTLNLAIVTLEHMHGGLAVDTPK